MKIKELLKVIPDNYLIGLMDSDVDNYSLLVFGNKKDVILGYGQRARLLPEQVKNLNVIAIHPGATAYMPPSGVELYGDDSAEVHVKSKLLIEVSLEEPEDND